MGFFTGMFVDEKNASKTTYSQDDIKKMELQYAKEFLMEKQKRAMSPYRKIVEPSTMVRIRDYAMEKILDDHLYTFKHLLVIPNPYGISSRTAMLLFNSSKKCSVVVSLYNENGKLSYQDETEQTDRHRVFIVGMLAGTTNKMVLELKNEEGKIIKRRNLSIFVKSDEKLLSNFIPVSHEKETELKDFIMISGYSNAGALIVDGTGKIRNVLENRKKITYRNVADGFYFYGDAKIKCIRDEKLETFRYHLVDDYGRVLSTFLLEDSIGKASCKVGDSLFLVVRSGENGEKRDIVELSLKDGKIMKRISIDQIFAPGKRAIKKIRKMQFIDGHLYVMAVGRTTIVKYDWENEKVVCGMNLRDVEGLSKIYGMELFKEQDDIRMFLQGEDTLYETEFKEKDARILQEIKTKQALYSVSVQISKDHQFIMTSSGNNPELGASWIQVFSLQSKKKVFDCILDTPFLAACFYHADLKKCQPLTEKKNTVFGKIHSLEEYTGNVPPLAEKQQKRKMISKIFLQNEMFLFHSIPGHIENIYFQGEKHCYIQRMSHLMTNIKRKIVFAIPLQDMECDEYQIYLERNGETKKLKNEIRIVTKEDMEL